MTSVRVAPAILEKKDLVATRDSPPRTTDYGHPEWHKPSETTRLSGVLRNPRFRFAASALSGVLLFACFPLLNWNWLVWVAALPLLAAVTSERRLGRAYLLGALAGAIFLLGSVYWFTYVMENYGHLSPVEAWGVMLLFLVVVSSFGGVFGLVEAWVARRSLLLGLLLSPFLWVSLELARTYYFFTGFPWNLLGYAVQPEGLRQLASFTAVYGLSFVAVGTSALLAGALLERGRRRKQAGWLAVALWFVFLFGLNRALRPPLLPPAENLVLLVQPNVPLNEAAGDWAPWRNPAPLERLVSLSLGSLPREGGNAPPLIIWSEDSAPFYFNRDPVFRATVENMARQARAYTIVGATNFTGQDTSRPLNSAVVLDPSGRMILQYDKIHLVPFGEYVPAWLAGKVGKIVSEVGNFVPGTTYQAAETPRGKVGVFICYEAIFPQLVRRLTPEGPGVLVNISDDAWYGDSSAAFQSLEMARWRAVESHRYLLRATNDGITALIDPYGRVVERLPRHQQAVLAGHFSYAGERTFYMAHGDVFAWLCVALTAALAAARLGVALGPTAEH